jgi:purine-cytosine permease-like protein
VAWIPNIVTFIVMLAVGGKHMVLMPAPASVSAAAIISYSSTVASSVISWYTMTPDYGVYHSGKASACVFPILEKLPLMKPLPDAGHSRILILSGSVGLCPFS